MFAYFNRFTLEMTLKQAQACSHSGQCDDDVEHALTIPLIRRQLAKLNPADIAAELKECGAWDAEELSDAEQNKRRIVWIAAGNIYWDSRGN